VSVTAELADHRGAGWQLLLEGERAERPSIELGGAGGGSTLDEFLVGVWERLTVHGAAHCPVCNGRVEAEYASHARPVGGRCADCETALS
jgi:hypothetical protein